MHAVCPSCGTKHDLTRAALAPGQKALFRCKRCEGQVTVEGAPCPREEPDTGTEASPGIEWHVILEGEVQGPHSPEALRSLLAEGRIDEASLLWRDGLQDWVPLGTTEVAERDLRAPGPPSTEEPPLTGARSDSSVLFSLAALRASVPPSSPSDGARPAGPSGGRAEGSGLIDIRALAASAAPAGEGPGHGERDGLGPSIPAALPGASPLLAPVMPPPSSCSRRRLTFALSGAGISLALVASILAVLIVRPSAARQSEDLSARESPPSPVIIPAPPLVPAEGSAPPSVPSHSTTADQGDSPLSEAPPESIAEPREPLAQPVAERRDRAAKRGSGPSGGPAEERPRRDEPAPVRGASSKAPPSLEDMIDRAIRGEGSSPDSASPEESESAAPSRLPDRLTTAQVAAGMRRAVGAVGRCARGEASRVVVGVTIEGATGRVSAVSVDPALRGTGAGACVDRALRRLEFPRFNERRLSVRRYPFVIR